MATRQMLARYEGRCAAGAECFKGGWVHVGDSIRWSKVGGKTTVVHLDGCMDVADGNEFGRLERLQEDLAYRREMAEEARLGYAHAEHVRETGRLFGEEAEAAEELAWELRLGDGY